MVVGNLCNNYVRIKKYWKVTHIMGVSSLSGQSDQPVQGGKLVTTNGSGISFKLLSELSSNTNNFVNNSK